MTTGIPAQAQAQPAARRLYMFADEAGNFDFSRGPGASRYFILTTVILDECGIGDELQALRREVAWGMPDLSGFHATEDKQHVRDRVFSLIASRAMRIDATILEKAKAQPHVRRSPTAFYKMAWYLHFKYVGQRTLWRADELLVVAASIATRSKAAQFRSAVDDVVSQVSWVPHRTTYWPAATDPCLQVADYCCWAIQRKWERGDERSYQLIKHNIASEFAPFAVGAITYY